MPIAVINKGPTAIDMRPSVEIRIEGGTSQWLTALATGSEPDRSSLPLFFAPRRAPPRPFSAGSLNST